MAAIRTGIDIIIDASAVGGANPLITETGSPAGVPRWIAGDLLDLRLRFTSPEASLTKNFTEASLPASWAVLFLVKEKPFSKAALAMTSDFGVSVDGDKTFYTALLNLNTVPLWDLLEFRDNTIELWAEIQLQDAGGTLRQSYQFRVLVGPKVIRGEGEPPAGALPEYPPPGAIPVALRGTYPVPTGTGSMEITVNHDRDYTPVVTVRAPNATAPFITARTRDVTRQSFFVDFSATIKQGGYYVDVIGL